MQKVNTAQEIIGYDHEPTVHMDGSTVTVKWAIQMACNTPIEKLPWTPECVVRCAELSKKAYEHDENGEVDYTDADRAFILDRSQALCEVGRNSPIVHTFLVNLFESVPVVGEPAA